MDIKRILGGYGVYLGTLCGVTATCVIAAPTQPPIEEDFTGTTINNAWNPAAGACLTAGAGTTVSSVQVPSCVTLPYYPANSLKGGQAASKLPAGVADDVGHGALRLTNAANSQTGAIVYSGPAFSADNGIQITFKTVTYAGSADGPGANGADGIVFFLINGTQSVTNPPVVGAEGGSMGYSCSNGNDNYNGLQGAYLGLGMDEWGNFLNEGDTTHTGQPSDGTHGGHDNYQPMRIGLRGAGNVSWNWLNALDSAKYPSTLSASKKKEAVQRTCRDGVLWDYSLGTPAATTTTVQDYAALPNAFGILPDTLRIANNTATTRDDAQPMTYKLKITQNGLLSLDYAYNGGSYVNILRDQAITAGGQPALPSTLRFGFSAGTGGSNNIHELLCFQATPAELASTSAGVNVQQSGEVRTESQVYLAYYHPNNWFGQLTSQNLVYNTTTNLVSIASTVNWDASCALTGGAGTASDACAATGTSTTAQTTRQFLSTNGSGGAGGGIALAWGNLSSTQKGWLNAGDSKGSDRLDYLLGSRSKEVSAGGSSAVFRNRTSLLGDIQDSSPTWVGPPNAPYASTAASTASSWSDKLFPAAAATYFPENSAGKDYNTFKTGAAATRLHVVYDGSNDGFMHGFEAGSYNSSGAFVASTNDGKEVMAFMPNEVLKTIHSTTNTNDYSSPSYAHNFFVDATPATGDLFYSGAWHTWLLSGLGGGGRSIFALDITNPANLLATNAATVVKGEWTVAQTGGSLGLTYGTPQIRRFHNGQWGAVFGNGLNAKDSTGATTGNPGVYVMLVDSSGVVSFKYLQLPTGTTGGTVATNSILSATAADLDGDHIVDYIYAGDIKGNLWRFDITSNDPTAWSTPRLMFTTTSGQPITTQVAVIAAPTVGGLPRVLVEFGTGEQIPQTLATPTTYASGTQSLYGVWDWDMSTWNGKNSTQYSAMTTAPSSTLGPGDLQSQTATDTSTTAGYRSVTTNTICYKNGVVTTACTAANNTKYGWKLNLPDNNCVVDSTHPLSSCSRTEQVVYNPIIANGAFIVNTTIPSADSTLSCKENIPTGWTMAIDPATGGATPSSFFANSTGNFGLVDGQVVNGVQNNATGSPSLVNAGGNPYLVSQTQAGIGKVTKIALQGSVGGRLNWIELR